MALPRPLGVFTTRGDAGAGLLVVGVESCLRPRYRLSGHCKTLPRAVILEENATPVSMTRDDET